MKQKYSNDYPIAKVLLYALAISIILILGFPILQDTTTEDSIPGLKLPTTGVWNGFNDHLMVLECSNNKRKVALLELNLKDHHNEVIGLEDFKIPGKGSFHTLLNKFPVKDSYGTLELKKQNISEKVSVTCRTITYRIDEEGRIQYATSGHMGEISKGKSSGVYNSMNPDQSVSNPVYNWLTIYNPGDEPFSAIVHVRSQDGTILPEKQITVSSVPPGGRTDHSMGHTRGQVVGIYEIEPIDDNQIYGAFLSRYSEVEPGKFSFSMNIPSSKGMLDTGMVPASTMGPAYNWGEIANVSSDIVSAEIEVFDRYANLLYQNVIILPEYAQYHEFLNKHIGELNVGFFRVKSSAPVIVQSLYYGLDPLTPNHISWAYNTMGGADFLKEVSFPINTNLNSPNWLKLFGGSASTPTTVKMKIFSADGSKLSLENNGILQIHGSADIPLHQFTGPDFIGSIEITSEEKFQGQLVRVFSKGSNIRNDNIMMNAKSMRQLSQRSNNTEAGMGSITPINPLKRTTLENHPGSHTSNNDSHGSGSNNDDGGTGWNQPDDMDDTSDENNQNEDNENNTDQDKNNSNNEDENEDDFDSDSDSDSNSAEFDKFDEEMNEIFKYFQQDPQSCTKTNPFAEFGRKVPENFSNTLGFTDFGYGTGVGYVEQELFQHNYENNIVSYFIYFDSTIFDGEYNADPEQFCRKHRSEKGTKLKWPWPEVYSPSDASAKIELTENEEAAGIRYVNDTVLRCDFVCSTCVANEQDSTNKNLYTLDKFIHSRIKRSTWKAPCTNYVVTPPKLEVSGIQDLISTIETSGEEWRGTNCYKCSSCSLNSETKNYYEGFSELNGEYEYILARPNNYRRTFCDDLTVGPLFGTVEECAYFIPASSDVLDELQSLNPIQSPRDYHQVSIIMNQGFKWINSKPTVEVTSAYHRNNSSSCESWTETRKNSSGEFDVTCSVYDSNTPPRTEHSKYFASIHDRLRFSFAPGYEPGRNSSARPPEFDFTIDPEGALWGGSEIAILSCGEKMGGTLVHSRPEHESIQNFISKCNYQFLEDKTRVQTSRTHERLITIEQKINYSDDQ